MADPFSISTPRLHAVLAAHNPGWADLPLHKIASGGTENDIYRLGDDLTLRVPRWPGYAKIIAKEARWLPTLAPHLPLDIPRIAAVLPPGPDLPEGALALRWVAGADADRSPPSDQAQAATDLAAFIRALHALPLPDDPPQGSRGGPLPPDDARFQEALIKVRSRQLADADQAAELWHAGLSAAPFAGTPVLLHGDLMPPNLLVRGGRLAAVIDWSCLSSGDPAYDLTPAFLLFDRPARAAFRTALAPDDATWCRARARIVWQAIVALPTYHDNNPVMTRLAYRALATATEDARS